MHDIIVIGGGIVGLSTAYKINKRFPQLKITVLEKENEVGHHQTGRNSGVIHSGLYYKPGSYKAKNCVSGRRELVAFAKTHKIPHEICGKIVVATKTSELPFLEKIFNNGISNDVEGIEFIDSHQITEIEPHCEGIRGIWVPCTGIISFKSVTKTLQHLISETFTQSDVLTGLKVKKIIKHNDYNEIITDKNILKCKYIINCAGLYSDKIAEFDGLKRTSRIVGFRGDYYDLTDKGKEKVRNLIYPVPNPAFPFLGVHFTRMVDGTIECGPNAVFVFKREGYKKTDFHFGETLDALTYKGTWKLFMKHWQFGFDEYKRAFSKKMFLNRLKGLIPSLEMDDLKPGRSGVRAMALGPDGVMIDDFEIRYNHNSLHVLNAPSPAATSGLAIGEEVANLAQKKFSIT